MSLRAADDLLTLVDDAVRKALAAGADHAEAYVREGRTTTLACKGGRMAPTESHAVGLGIRVMVDGRLGQAGTAGLHRTPAVVEEAVRLACEAPRDAHHTGFADPRPVPRPPGEVADEIRAPDPDRLASMAQAAMDAMASPETTFSAFAVTSGTSMFAVANDAGVATWDRSGRESARFENRVSSATRSVTGWDTATALGPLERSVDLEEMGRLLTERARMGLHAEPLGRDVDQVLFDVAPTAQVFGPFLQSLFGGRVVGGRTPLADKVDEQVISPAVTLHDAPVEARGQRLRVDHEGVPTEDKPLIEDGVLRRFLFDTITARRAGAEPTGNGVRGRGWSGGVGAASIHPLMGAGRGSVEDMVAECDRAVLVHDALTGMFTANSNTGDFSVTTPYAFLIEDGEVRHALPHATVAGNVHRVLEQVVRVGKDLREVSAGTFAPILAGGASCAT